MKLKAMSRWLSSPSFKDCLKNTVKKYNGKTACQNRWQAFLCIKMLFVCNQKDKGTGVQLVFKGLFKGFLVIFQNGIASASENV